MTLGRLRLHSVRVPFGAGDDEVRRAVAAKIGRPPDTLAGLTLVRRSLDVRAAPNISWALAIEFDGEASLISGLPANEAAVVEPVEVVGIERGREPLGAQPVVVGAGPAGLFAALALAENGYAPLVIEQGAAVERRKLDVAAFVSGEELCPESNLLFGEGGAGAFSDGKLTTRKSDPHVRRVLETLVECGAPTGILIDARPHVGSDLLPGVVVSLRRRIEAGGGRFRFDCRVERLALDSAGCAAGVLTCEGHSIAAGAVVLAPGNWADALFEALGAQGVALAAKPFQMGVRIEHPQGAIDLAVYKRERGELPAAEYVMSARAGGVRGVATFCMCPGGIIVPAVCRAGRLSVNGASESTRSGEFANAALVVTISPDEIEGDGVLRGLRFQRALEEAAFDVSCDYRAPAQRAADFLRGDVSGSVGRSSYPLGVVPADLRGILPRVYIDALEKALAVFDGKLPGFVDEGLLVAVEARASSAVRILRDGDSRESVSTPNLYPAGEGSGYAGGITSSAVDGLRSAEALIGRFSPP